MRCAIPAFPDGKRGCTTPRSAHARMSSITWVVEPRAQRRAGTGSGTVFQGLLASAGVCAFGLSTWILWVLQSFIFFAFWIQF
jgi:hypothetical protein